MDTGYYPNDAGSTFCDESRKRVNGRGLGRNKPEDVKTAILKRGTVVEANFPATGWNEICCHDFKVVGLFADRQALKFALPSYPLEVSYTLSDVGTHFPKLPLYFGSPIKGLFVRLEWDANQNSYAMAKTVAWADIYDEPQRF
ncbi:MAG: hypothetical protein J0L73_08600 [Verrucomicrobia bacterium]|nr:hypothetical protein [Verrucomicrobiota bacterium]